jgi:hypothetical protein
MKDSFVVESEAVMCESVGKRFLGKYSICYIIYIMLNRIRCYSIF